MTTPEPPVPADPFGTPPPASFAISNPPTKKRKKWPFIVGGIVAVLVVLGVVGVAFGRKGSDTPHDAVNKFWTAVAAHDLDKAQKYVCDGKGLKAKDSSQEAEFKTFMQSVQSFSIGAETGSGDTRHYPVSLHLTQADASVDGTMDTEASKSAGQWYVCDLGSFTPNE